MAKKRKVSSVPSLVNYTVRLAPHHVAALLALAEKSGRRPSDVVRSAIVSVLAGDR